MAKGPFILHGASKKIGNMVVYKNPNSNNADTTVAREYVAEVKNPKTRQQAIQRMRMLPAQQFYRAFREILDHSWQGIKYGGRSYAHFMKAALADKTITIPYLLKGTTDFVPGAYPVSQGSLPKISVDTSKMPDNGALTNIKIGDLALSENTTFGDLSTAILANNSQFKEGDFITGLFCWQVDNQFFTDFYRFKIDSTDTTTVAQSSISVLLDSNEKTMGFIPKQATDPFIGAAYIHSRKPAEGSTVWQRSNASFELGSNAIGSYTTPEAEEAAIASYQSTAGNVNAHWYLNGGAQ